MTSKPAADLSASLNGQLAMLSASLSEVFQKLNDISKTSVQNQTEAGSMQRRLVEVETVMKELRELTFDSAKHPSLLSRLVSAEATLSEVIEALDELAKQPAIVQLAEDIRELQAQVQQLITDVREMSKKLGTTCPTWNRDPAFCEDLGHMVDAWRTGNKRKDKWMDIGHNVLISALVLIVGGMLVYFGKVVWQDIKAQVHSKSAPAQIAAPAE